MLMIVASVVITTIIVVDHDYLQFTLLFLRCWPGSILMLINDEISAVPRRPNFRLSSILVVDIQRGFLNKNNWILFNATLRSSVIYLSLVTHIKKLLATLIPDVMMIWQCWNIERWPLLFWQVHSRPDSGILSDRIKILSANYRTTFRGEPSSSNEQLVVSRSFCCYLCGFLSLRTTAMIILRQWRHLLSEWLMRDQS